MTTPPNERITRRDIDAYKREILEQTVLVRLDETAEILAVSVSTVIRRAEEGVLIPYNDGQNKGNNKGLRFLASDLRDYVRQMKAQHAVEKI